MNALRPGVAGRSSPEAGAVRAPGRAVRHPRTRLLAWLIDWLCILVWVAVTAAAGIPLYATGVIRAVPFLALNLIAAVVMVAPITIILAVFDSGRRQASPGKRVMNLALVRAGSVSRIRFPRALARNALKVALPWTLGHAAVIGLSASNPTASTAAPMLALTAVAYLLPIVYVVSLFVGSGRTPYDRVCGTEVAVLSPRHKRTSTNKERRSA